MKIKTLDIYGYGKWINQTFEIEDNLQLFYGKNETGKSTLQSFIRSVLFGFPSKRRRKNQLNRFEPKHSDVYGGRILLTGTKYGDVWVERTSKELKISQKDGTGLSNTALDEILGGLDETLFDNFYAFNLQNLQELSNVGADQLNEYFLSIGTLGSDKFLKIAKKLEKETDKLYRPQASNPPINQLLTDYEQTAIQLDNLKDNMDRYNQLVAKQTTEEQKIINLNEQINQYETELNKTDQLISRYDIYLKDKAAKRELEALIFTDIPEKAPENLSESLKKIDQGRQQVIQLEERIKNLTNELNGLTRLNWAVNNGQARKEWLKETNRIKDVQGQIEQTNRLIYESNDYMSQIAQRSQFYPEKIADDDAYENKIDQGLEIQTSKDEKQKEIDKLQSERKIYLDQRKEQQNYSAVVRQQVAQLENQRMNEEERLIQETSLKDYFFGGLFLIIGLVIIGYNFILSESVSTIYLIFGVIIGLIGATSLIYIFVRHRQRFSDFRTSPALEKMDNLRKQEKQYQEKSKELGVQINHAEEVIQQYQEEFATIELEQKRWLSDIGFYPTADPEIILKTNPVQEYFDAKKKRTNHETELDKLDLQVNEWRELIRPLVERFATEDMNTRSMIRFVEETEAELAQTETKGQQIQSKIDEANNEIETLKETIDSNTQTINQIYQTTDSENELEFNQKLNVNQRIEDLKAKRELYLDQIRGHEKGLSEIESKQSLNEAYQATKQTLNRLKEEKEPHQNERANMTVEIQNLEQDGTYQDVLQKLQYKETQIKDAVVEWGHQRVAMETIQQTLRQGLDNPMPEMNEIANEIFSILSFNRYTQIKLNKQSIKVKHNSDILFEPFELSQGTLEQLYVALRLAFIISAIDLVKMPIIIDDAFVNFDEVRKTSMYQVLERISDKIQVLFFTFDQQAEESFGDYQIINLENYTSDSNNELETDN